MTKRSDKFKLNSDAFNQVERDPVTRSDVESALRQVLGHPAKPGIRSENREPTVAEIGQRWKLERRG
ncbi:MAG: hypothetical protein F4X40_02715 [Chloroflexi bacterium]|nr:hypothetical protein [Chloroflexota bacterium]